MPPVRSKEWIAVNSKRLKKLKKVKVEKEKTVNSKWAGQKVELEKKEKKTRGKAGVSTEDVYDMLVTFVELKKVKDEWGLYWRTDVPVTEFSSPGRHASWLKTMAGKKITTMAGKNLVVRFKTKLVTAGRAVWMLHNGKPVPEGKTVQCADKDSLNPKLYYLA